MNTETRDFISQCEICRSLDDKQCKETLISHEVPEKPWRKNACDIFTFNDENYLVTRLFFKLLTTCLVSHQRQLSRNLEHNLQDIGFPPYSLATMDRNLDQRILLNLLPIKESLLVPEVPDKKEQGKKFRKLKERQSHYCNLSAKDLKPLKIQDPVRIAPPDGIRQLKEWKKGVVTSVLPNRSYKVQSDGQLYCRNRRHLKPSKHQQ